MICNHCHNKHDGWIRQPDGYGCVEWVYCVCAPTNSLQEQANEQRSNAIHIGADTQNADANCVTSK